MDDALPTSPEATRLEQGIARLRAGDTSVRGELLNIACGRLEQLTERLRREFERIDDGRSTEEILRGASLRLHQALYDTPIRDARHFYQVATSQIRRELVDLCRECQDRSRRHAAAEVDGGDDAGRAGGDAITAAEIRGWAVLHDSIDALPAAEREVFELVWYHEISREQTAQLLGLPIREVRRLWRSARLKLDKLLGDDGLPANSDAR